MGFCLYEFTPTTPRMRVRGFFSLAFGEIPGRRVVFDATGMVWRRCLRVLSLVCKIYELVGLGGSNI